MINKKTLLAVLLLLMPQFVQLSAQSKHVSLKEITSGYFYPKGAGGSFRPMGNSGYYTEATPDHKAIVSYSFETGKAVDTLFNVRTARDCDFKNFGGYIIGPEGKHILLLNDIKYIYRRSFTANVYDYDVRRKLVKPLSDKGGAIRIPTFSPDGRMVAFVRDNNIFIKKFDFDTEVQVTTDGKFNHIINGATDWVYEEEFAQTNLMSFSADGSYLAYVRTDESRVKEYSMPMYLGRDDAYPTEYRYKYPKAGEDNSKVSLYVYNIADRNSKPVKLDLPSDGYIPRIEFTKNSDQLAVVTMNRHQNDLKLWFVNPMSLLSKLIMEDRNTRYVDEAAIHSIEFLKDGFVYMSEKDGYQHIYLYALNGQLKKQVTKGKWDVTAFYGIDPKGNVYYQSCEESPIRRAVYMIDAKGRKTKLSTREGWNSAQFSGDYKYFINTFSSANHVPVVALYKTSNIKKPLRVLQDNKDLEGRLAQFQTSKKEFITVKNDHGDLMNAWIVKPLNFDPNKKYPLVMVQYSGPNSQQVKDSYGFDWEQYLADQGFVVACVDGRGTGARGEEWRKCHYLKLGTVEPEDQVAAAKQLGKLPYIDPSRMAIWGWSFGGYNTLLSLCKGNGTFKVGIAVAPVTDYRFYDTIYTERYMRTPQENPQGYDEGSVLKNAQNLKGKVLIIHGSADDNVHLQNTMALTDLLVKYNIPFDEAIYTDKNHSIYGGNTRYHLYTRMANYLKANL